MLTEAGLAGALPDRAAEFEAALGRLPAERRADPAVAAALAMVRLCRGDPESAEAYLGLAALALDESAPDRLVIELWLAMLRLIRQPDASTVASCRSLAEQARASAGRQSEHQALGLLWLTLGTVLLCRWEVADSASALTSANHQLTAAGARSLALRARGWLALSAALSGDLAAAAVLSERAARHGPAPIPRRRAWRRSPRRRWPSSETTCSSRCGCSTTPIPAALSPLPGEPDIAVLLALARARAALAEGDAERASDVARLAREKYEKAGPVLSALDFDAALRAGDLRLAVAALGPAGPRGRT